MKFSKNCGFRVFAALKTSIKESHQKSQVTSPNIIVSLSWSLISGRSRSIMVEVSLRVLVARLKDWTSISPLKCSLVERQSKALLWSRSKILSFITKTHGTKSSSNLILPRTSFWSRTQKEIKKLKLYCLKIFYRRIRLTRTSTKLWKPDQHVSQIKRNVPGCMHLSWGQLIGSTCCMHRTK